MENRGGVVGLETRKELNVFVYVKPLSQWLQVEPWAVESNQPPPITLNNKLVVSSCLKPSKTLRESSMATLRLLDLLGKAGHRGGGWR